jgi:hypothetical protein
MMLSTVVNVGSTRAFGAWSYARWRRRKSAPLYLVIRFGSNLGWIMRGGGAAQRWWDYVAKNVRLGKEEK